MLLCALLVVAHHGEVFTPVPQDRRCFICVLLGFHRLLRHLIQRGIDVDARDAHGYTALHTFAALSGRLACARILVKGGADVEIVEARGRTAREMRLQGGSPGLGCLSPNFPLYPPSQTCPVYPCRNGHSYRKFQFPKLGFHMPHILLVFPMDIPTPSWLLPSIYLVVIACGLYRGIPIVLTSAQDLAKVVLYGR